jgi:hypothetical protein
MDPDEALRLLRAAIGDLAVVNDEAAGEVVEHFTALDGWLSAGGFLPSAWQPKTSSASA